MHVELKDLLTWGGMLIGLIAQWFHLKGRVSAVELKQEMDRLNHEQSMEMHRAMHEQAIETQRSNHKDALDRIDKALEQINRKLDGKADK